MKIPAMMTESIIRIQDPPNIMPHTPGASSITSIPLRLRPNRVRSMSAWNTCWLLWLLITMVTNYYGYYGNCSYNVTWNKC